MLTSNPTLAQNPTTGDAAHLDPMTNSWSTEAPPTDFVPDPTGTAPLTYINPTTGQQLIYVGYEWWIDPIDHRPPIFYFDVLSGRTAWFNPITDTWVAPTPPPGFSADMSVPRSQQGAFYTDGAGDKIYYSAREGGWFNYVDLKPYHVRTVDRPETGGDAGRVTITGPIPAARSDTLGHNTPYASRLMALQRGDRSVPTGNPAKDYQRDVQNLEESKALRDEMQKAGAGNVEMGIINTHINDLERYITMWNDHVDDKGKFEFGGAVLVNENAQLDDLGAGMNQTGIIANDALGHLGTATTGAVTENIQARGTGGGGSETVIPRYRTTQQYLEGKGLDPLPPRPGRSQPVAPRPGATGDFLDEKGIPRLPPRPDTAGAEATDPTGPGLAGSETRTLPPGSPGTDTQTLPPGQPGTETQALPAAPDNATRTDAGRPSAEKLGEARQAAGDRAINRAVQRAERERAENAEIDMRTGGTDTAYDNPKGGDARAAAARFGKETSLHNTPYDEVDAYLNMRGARTQLQELVDGKMPEVPPTPETVKIMYAQYEKGAKAVADGQRAIPDYWDRMTAENRALVRGELEAGKNEGLEYWQSKLQERQAPAIDPGSITISPDNAELPPSGPSAESPSGSASGGVPITPGFIQNQLVNDTPRLDILSLPSGGAPQQSADRPAPAAGSDGSPATANTGSAIRIKNIRMDASGVGAGGGMLDRFRSGIVTPIGMGTVIGLGLLGGFGGANVFATPAHVIQVPVVGQATPAPPPAGPLTITPITATLSADGRSTIFQVTATNVYGFQGTSWSLTPPSGAPDCNHLTMASGKATWLHGPNDDCGSFGGSATSIPGVAMVRVTDGSGFHCTATYSGSLSGTGPAPTCQGGGPTMNPNFNLGGTSTGPTSTLVSKTVPGTLSVLGTFLGALFGAALGCWLLGAVIATGRTPMTRSRIGDGVAIAATPPILADDAVPAVAPKPIMPAVGAKKKQRSCQNELNALNKAQQALDKAKANARAANDAVNAAKEAADSAGSAKDYADYQLNAIQNPQPGQSPPRVQEGGSLRSIVRKVDKDGNMLPPSADDLQTADPAFSHLMTLGEAQRNADKATSDLAQAKANLAAAQTAARSADAAVDTAVKAFEDAREAYGKCVQLQREGL